MRRARRSGRVAALLGCALGAALIVIALGGRARAQQQSAPRRVELGAAIALGARSADALWERRARVVSLASRCDRQVRTIDGEAQVAVRLAVAGSGRVSHAQQIGSGDGAPEGWRRCVVAALSELRLPAGAEGTLEVVIAWRFVDPVEAPGVRREPVPIPAAPFHWAPPRALLARPDASAARPELTPDVIQQTVRGRLDAVRRCYERARDESPELAGRIVIRFAIDPDGIVRGVETIEDEPGSRELETCARYQVQMLQFPAHRGVAITVVYPFVFGAGAPSSAP